MLHEFLSANRSELIARCSQKVRSRGHAATGSGIEHGIPFFLDQLIRTLRVEQSADPERSRSISGASGGAGAVSSEMGETATMHGRELLRQGFTIDQLVHDYGDVCQSISELAFERNAMIEVDEFRTLNSCLDNAIATAATEFNYQRDSQLADGQMSANDRLAFFAHELRNLINNATLALSAIKAGGVGLGGATGAVLDRSLVGLRNLVDKTLTEVRMTAGTQAHRRLFSLADFIGEIKHSAVLEAQVRESGLTVSLVDPALAVRADRDLLLSAVGNLLQNAFKFTAHKSEVTLSAYASGDRILIDVADHCGGLPEGHADKVFVPYVQAGTDRSGLGLGLSISRQSVEANGGILRVRDVPGTGCVFTIDLPRHASQEIAQRLH